MISMIPTYLGGLIVFLNIALAIIRLLLVIQVLERFNFQRVREYPPPALEISKISLSIQSLQGSYLYGL